MKLSWTTWLDRLAETPNTMPSFSSFPSPSARLPMKIRHFVFVHNIVFAHFPYYFQKISVVPLTWRINVKLNIIIALVWWREKHLYVQEDQTIDMILIFTAITTVTALPVSSWRQDKEMHRLQKKRIQRRCYLWHEAHLWRHTETSSYISAHQCVLVGRDLLVSLATSSQIVWFPWPKDSISIYGPRLGKR